MAIGNVSMDEDEANARNVEGAKYVSMDAYEADARNVREKGRFIAIYQTISAKTLQRKILNQLQKSIDASSIYISRLQVMLSYYYIRSF